MSSSFESKPVYTYKPELVDIADQQAKDGAKDSFPELSGITFPDDSNVVDLVSPNSIIKILSCWRSHAFSKDELAAVAIAYFSGNSVLVSHIANRLVDGTSDHMSGFIERIEGDARLVGAEVLTIVASTNDPELFRDRGYENSPGTPPAFTLSLAATV